MAIDVIRGRGTKAHMVRPGTEMVIREGRDPDGRRTTEFSAMGICGTEISIGTITLSETASDVSCGRCAKRAEAVLAADAMDAAEAAAAPVLSSPEAVTEPRRRRVYSPGRIRHGKVTAERAERRHQMKERVRELAGANPQR